MVFKWMFCFLNVGLEQMRIKHKFIFHQNIGKYEKKKTFLMNIIVQQYKKLGSELSFSS